MNLFDPPKLKRTDTVPTWDPVSHRESGTGAFSRLLASSPKEHSGSPDGFPSSPGGSSTATSLTGSTGVRAPKNVNRIRLEIEGEERFSISGMGRRLSKGTATRT